MSSFRTIEVSDSPFESNGLRFLTVKTEHLQGRGDICLYVPDLGFEVRDLPIYILLHGVYGSAWVWPMKAGVHLVAQRLIQEGEIEPAILAMPSDGLWGDGSAYYSHHGKCFDQWIVDDVPQAIVENIQEASKQSKLCIGGLSMGGYGALMLGARYADRFEAISGHSSITCLEQMALFVEEPIEDYLASASEKDVIDVFRKSKDRLPPIRFDCGREDTLLEANRLLDGQLKDEGIPHIYEEYDGGHEWPYWQEHVSKSLKFFNKHSKH